MAEYINPWQLIYNGVEEKTEWMTVPGGYLYRVTLFVQHDTSGYAWRPISTSIAFVPAANVSKTIDPATGQSR